MLKNTFYNAEPTIVKARNGKYGLSKGGRYIIKPVYEKIIRKGDFMVGYMQWDGKLLTLMLTMDGVVEYVPGEIIDFDEDGIAWFATEDGRMMWHDAVLCDHFAERPHIIKANWMEFIETPEKTFTPRTIDLYNMLFFREKDLYGTGDEFQAVDLKSGYTVLIRKKDPSKVWRVLGYTDDGEKRLEWMPMDDDEEEPQTKVQYLYKDGLMKRAY